MRVITALLFFLMIISRLACALAYEVRAVDHNVYKFADGKDAGGADKYIVTYDINEGDGRITEIKRSGGSDKDVPHIIPEAFYKIISKNENALTAKREWNGGEELLIFYTGGDYYLFEITALPKNEDGSAPSRKYTIVRFGKYSVDLKFLE